LNPRAASTLLGAALCLSACDDSRIQQASAARAAAPDRRANADCGAQASFEQLKAAAFAQARQLRPEAAPVFDRLAAGSVVRVEDATSRTRDDALNAIVCRGRMVIELPPGTTDPLSGDRRLVADLDYAAQAGADGQVRAHPLGGLDPIAYRLAAMSLAGGASPVPAAIAAPVTVPIAPPAPPVRSSAATFRPASYERPVPRAAIGKTLTPGCRYPMSRSQQMLCADDRLAMLDREARFLYRRALARAAPEARAKLRKTDGKFLARRERCRRWACIEDVYEDRIEQIERIASRD
jgi:hypothetical protein